MFLPILLSLQPCPLYLNIQLGVNAYDFHFTYEMCQHQVEEKYISSKSFDCQKTRTWENVKDSYTDKRFCKNIISKNKPPLFPNIHPDQNRMPELGQEEGEGN